MVTSGRLGPRALLIVDALVGVALALAAVFRTPEAPVLAAGLGVVLGLPLAVRRHVPVPVLAVVLAAGAAAIVVGACGEVAIYAIAFALYPVGLSTSPRDGVLALTAALAAVVTAALAVLTIPGLPAVAPPQGEESFATSPLTVLPTSVLILAGSWTLARAMRSRRAHADQLAEMRAHQAATDERLRIARDVHDAVGHSLSLIAMKAAVADHLLASHPAEGRAALNTIERISRGALDDVRAVLGAVRELTPGIAELPRLVEDTRAAGVAVEVDTADLEQVPAGVQTSAYRIVQEALTNVLRHADATRCLLGLSVDRGALVVTVVDDGRARVPGPPGHGLLGMRERVAVHGGTLHAGAQPAGGFAVRARLPFVPAAPNG